MKSRLLQVLAVMSSLALAGTHNGGASHTKAVSSGHHPATKLFLTYSDKNNKRIGYVQVEEQADLSLKSVGEPIPLIENIENPSYMTYDFKHGCLFVCNKDQILKYHVLIDEEAGSLSVDEEVVVLVDKIACQGLAVDNFGNLFFSDHSFNQILKMNRKEIHSHKYNDSLGAWEDSHESPDNYSSPPYHVKYSEKLSEGTVVKPLAIHLEREYLYWSNGNYDAVYNKQSTSIHKAFSEPFVQPIPFQSYNINNVWKAMSIATNPHYMFFTGNLHFDETGHTTTYNEDVFVQKKQGAYVTTTINGQPKGMINNPGALLTYKDSLLLIANRGFISQLDVRRFPPTADDFHESHVVDLPGFSSTSDAPLGMVFISKYADELAKETMSSAAPIISALSTLLCLALTL